MAHGYFPLWKLDPNATKLRQAAQLIDEARDSCLQGCQGDHYGDTNVAFADGAVFAGLELAIELVQKAVY